MQYMLLIYGEAGAYDSLSEEEHRALYAEYGELTRELQAQGQLVSANELHAVDTASTLRVHGGEALVTDGPFAETKETLGGYYLIEAESLDEALEWAARIPSARFGPVEVRPVVEHRGGGS